MTLMPTAAGVEMRKLKERTAFLILARKKAANIALSHALSMMLKAKEEKPAFQKTL